MNLRMLIKGEVKRVYGMGSQTGSDYGLYRGLYLESDLPSRKANKQIKIQAIGDKMVFLRFIKESYLHIKQN